MVRFSEQCITISNLLYLIYFTIVSKFYDFFKISEAVVHSDIFSIIDL